MTTTLKRRLFLAAGISSLLLSSWAVSGFTAEGAKGKSKGDKAAPVEEIGIFDGIKQGDLKVKVVLKNSLSGNLVVQNMANRPLKVELPEGFVAIPVLAQPGRTTGRGGATGGAAGGPQVVGGGGGGAGGGGGGGNFGGGGGGGMGGGGGGFFSIPADKTVHIRFDSVCLEHGKAEPKTAMTYEMKPLEEYTQDKQVQTLVKAVGTGKLDPKAAQAAAWNLANHMSWEELANKTHPEVLTPDTPYFTREQLDAAQNIVLAVQVKVKEEEEAAADAKSANASEKTAEKPVKSASEKN